MTAALSITYCFHWNWKAYVGRGCIGSLRFGVVSIEAATAVKMVEIIVRTDNPYANRRILVC